MPQVSVIIPTYNREKIIKRSIMSVLNQTLTDVELIIVDDGSTDNTEDEVKSINDSRIRYVKQKNQGACVARNRGIDEAVGEYIAFQDSDDEWYPDKLEKQLACSIKNNADIVFAQVEVGGQIFPKEFYPQYEYDAFLPKDAIFTYGMVTTPVVFCKSEVLKKNKFDVTLPRRQDFELALRIAEQYKVFCMDEILMNQYVQDDSITSNPQKLIDAVNIIFEKYEDLYKIHPEYKISLLNDLVHAHAQQGKNDSKSSKEIYHINRSKANLAKYIATKLRVYILVLKIISKLRNKSKK